MQLKFRSLPEEQGDEIESQEPTLRIGVERFLDQNATDAIVQWQNVANKIDNDLFMRLLIQPFTVNNTKKAKGAKDTKTIRATFIALFLGNSSRLMSLVSKEFPALGLTNQDCFQMSWIDSANFDNTTKPNILLNRRGDSLNFVKRKSDYVQEPIPKAGLESIFQKIISLGKAGLVFNPYGGRMAEIPEDETPFPHRKGILFKIQYSVTWNSNREKLPFRDKRFAQFHDPVCFKES
ncbi:hypothetical protein CQW23_16501 [Capsicum baccatum]|uniref:Reticuline oxidase-like protein n=1 Tax=Capsicum baccatum TaxID=33114 RepID=A0A2G2WB39_CAPBA|nr:hypothetical protein CQW23_16501 [Capsicum baccatum]